MLTELGESSEVVTYQEDDPESLIQQFKRSSQKWIISISMISEGTNIPRLRVCCYLSLVTTELYFRQVLGRVLRAQSSPVETGYFIMPAHPRLLEYSNRVADEVPHYAVIKSSGNKGNKEGSGLVDSNIDIDKDLPPNSGVREKSLETTQGAEIGVEAPKGSLTSWYDSSIDSFGRFQQKVFML